VKIIGHRGARGLAPENTLPSFKKALDIGVDQIEFDVRVTHDHVPILYHNATIVDGAGDKFLISNCRYEDLKAHKPDLAKLEEALETVKGAVPLYIEVKSDVNIGPIVEILKGYRHAYALSSFSQRTLRELQTSLPKIPKIVIDNWSGVRARLRAKQIGTRTIAMNQTWLWSGFIRAMKRSSYELYAYTVNNPAKARRWAKYGLAGVITDYPDRFKN